MWPEYVSTLSICKSFPEVSFCPVRFCNISVKQFTLASFQTCLPFPAIAPRYLWNNSTWKRICVKKHCPPGLWTSLAFDSLTRSVIKQNSSNLTVCYPTSFPHTPRQIWGIYDIVRGSFLSLLSEALVVSYWSSRYSCFHQAIIYKYGSSKISFGTGHMITSQGWILHI